MLLTKLDQIVQSYPVAGRPHAGAYFHAARGSQYCDCDHDCDFDLRQRQMANLMAVLAHDRSHFLLSSCWSQTLERKTMLKSVNLGFVLCDSTRENK